jgi:hypothetical protein
MINRLDDKFKKKENTLSDNVAKLKWGSYKQGARDDAVCKSALACGNRKPKAYEQVSGLNMWLSWWKNSV